MSVISQFESTLDRHQMIPPSGPVVLAVSGGADSVALLACMIDHFAVDAPSRIVVAHLNHQLRPTAGDDAEFVSELARTHGLPCVVGEEDVSAYAEENSVSFECAGRTVRYEFLARVAVDFGASAVATGHHADDQAETVLMRVLRGTGLRGLAGMPMARPFGPPSRELSLIRPLLEVPRADIEEFCAERRLAFRTDETNDQTVYRRNFVRLELLPIIRERLQPQATAVLCRLAQIARDADAHIHDGARPFLAGATEGEPFHLEAGQLSAIPPALRSAVLSEGFRIVSGGFTLSHAHVDGVLTMSKEGRAGSLDLRAGWTARVNTEGITLTPPGRTDDDEASEPGWRVSLPVPGEAGLPDGSTIVAAVRERPAGQVPPRVGSEGAVEEWLDYDALGAPGTLVVRSRLPGDRVHLLGSPGGRSVKRAMIDMKIPRDARTRTPLVCVPGGAVLWLAPHRISESAKITADTKALLVLTIA